MKIVKNKANQFILTTIYAEHAKRLYAGFGTESRELNEKQPRVALRIGDYFTANLINSLRDDVYRNSPYLKDSENIHPEYLEWLDKAKEVQNNPDLWEPLPQFSGAAKPRPWQEMPLRFVLTFKRVGLGVAMGGGKTYIAGQTLDYLAEKARKEGKPFRALWVTKKEGDLHTQTYQELKYKFKFKNINPLFLKGQTIKDKAENVAFEDLDGVVYMCNYEMFRPEAGSRGNSLIDAFLELTKINGNIFTAVVFDESSNLRNHTEHLRGLVYFRGGHWPTYADQPAYRLGEYVIELSGEPAPQGPPDWCHQNNMLHPIILPWNTVNGMKKIGARMDPWSKKITWEGWFLERLHFRCRQFWYVLTKKDLEEQGLKIPAVMKLVKVKMTQIQAKLYYDMQDDLVAELERKKKKIETEFSRLMDSLWDNGETSKLDEYNKDRNRKLQVAANNILAQMLRLTQITGGYIGGMKPKFDDIEEGEDFDELEGILETIPGKNPKLEKLLELVSSDEHRELVEEPQADGTVKIISKVKPFVVFARFRHEIAIIHERLQELNFKGGTIQGSQPGKNRESREAFQRGDYDYVVINPASGKFGGNYQRASYAYYFSNSSKGEERNQSMGRLIRDGQMSNVTITDLVCEGTIDLTVLSILKKKKNISDLVLYKLPDLLNGRLTEEEENELQGYLED